MRVKQTVAAVAAAMAAALCTAPQAGAAAACGTTADQWVGRFAGTVYYPQFDSTSTLRVVVERGGPNGLTVETTNGGETYAPRDEYTAVNSGTLDWYGVTELDYWHYYNTTAATCSGDAVSTFSGRERVPWAAPGWYYYGDFQLTRVG